MIGVFDSGFGGLTILRDLRKVLPDLFCLLLYRLTIAQKPHRW